MGEQLLGMVSGETQHLIGSSADPAGKPQGRNYSTAIDQTGRWTTEVWEHKRALIPPVMSTAVGTSTAPRNAVSRCHGTGIKNELKMSKCSLQFMADFQKCSKIQSLKR